MGKISKKEEYKEKQEIELTQEVIKKLASEVKEFGKDAFLLKRMCIKIDEAGNWMVLEYPGLKGMNADFGYCYQSDIPFTFWREVLEQVLNYMAWQDRKYKEQQELLAN